MNGKLFAILLLNLPAPHIHGMDTGQPDLVERLQQVTITNKSRQQLYVWQAVDWNFIQEQQAQPVQQTSTITNLAYQVITWLLFPHMTKPKNSCAATGGIENEICTLSPEQSHNFNVMVCTKIEDGYYKKRTHAFIKIRNQKPSGPIWGPVICSYALNTDANVSCVITENADQELAIQQQE